jgi:hypothetical protein
VSDFALTHVVALGRLTYDRGAMAVTAPSDTSECPTARSRTVLARWAVMPYSTAPN